MHPARGDMYSVYIVSALLSRLVRRSEHKETLREHLLRYLDALSPDGSHNHLLLLANRILTPLL
jgi:hypothetical protein